MTFDSDPAKYDGIQEALSYYDNALNTMGGAHVGLYSGSIRELGSEELKAKYLPLADSFELPGCFALTGKHEDLFVLFIIMLKYKTNLF